MTRHFTLLPLAACLFCMCAVAPAFSSTFTTSVLDEETDIVNTGLALIEASNFGGTGAATVNGIPHANSNSTYSPVNFSGPFGDPNGGVFTGDFFTLIDGIAGTTNANEPGTLTVPGLSVGENYLFQSYWLVKDNFGSRTLDLTLEGESFLDIAANANTSEAVLISYEFTATDTTFDAQFVGNGGDNNVWSQGFSLQQAPATVPEPGSVAIWTLVALAVTLPLLRRGLRKG